MKKLNEAEQDFKIAYLTLAHYYIQANKEKMSRSELYKEFHSYLDELETLALSEISEVFKRYK